MLLNTSTRGRSAAIAAILLSATSSLALAPVAASAQAVGPTAIPGFSITTFATAPSGTSAPDSVVLVGADVWVGFGNGGAPDGSGGAVSNIVEFSPAGAVLQNITVVGHNDGLRLDPTTGKLWATQNEDANPNLVLIDPTTGAASAPIALTSANGGGGYDDIAFVAGKTYISASNPTLNAAGVNVFPAIVQAKLAGSTVKIIGGVLGGSSQAFNDVTGRTDKLNLTDPDSLIATPFGDLLLTDQADAQLILVHISTARPPRVEQIPLAGGVQVDDTAYATTSAGTLYIADQKGNTIYQLSSPFFEPNTPYSSSTGVAASGAQAAVPPYVGRLVLSNGTLLPVVTGLLQPKGLAFNPGR